MNHLTIHGIDLPLPDDWRPKPAEGHTGYVGEGGLLDVRLKPGTVAIDEARLQLAREKFAGRNATVSLLTMRGCRCLCCTYSERDCQILSLCLAVTAGSELHAVYVFRPGHEDLAEFVQGELFSQRSPQPFSSLALGQLNGLS